VHSAVRKACGSMRWSSSNVAKKKLGGVVVLHAG